MKKTLVVFGAGGHGKVVCEVLRSAGESVDFFIDDSKQGSRALGIEVLPRSALPADGRLHVALGIGDNVARSRIAAECTAMGATLVTAIHPKAVVSPSATIEEGVVVFALAVINADARIERGAIINTAAVVEHDCVVGAFAHVSPNAAMAGGCAVGARAQLGIGASMLPGTTVGEGSVVGGGAVVVRDIPAGCTAAGVPARPRR